MKSPAAAWPEIRGRIRSAGALALFLDYDGTLTPIVRHPSKAALSPATRVLLRSLSRQPGIWVAVVSGRSLKDVRRRVGVSRLYYVGNHGLEIQGPKLRHINPMAQRSRPVMEEIVGKLRQALQPVPKAWVEDKGLTLSVHYREAVPPDRLRVRSAFHDAVRPYREKRQVRVTAGRGVFEVRPPVRWTKGTVVNWLLAGRTALSRGGPVLPVYVGDDLTDEDAFQALGKRGITVVVGSANLLTRAQYRVGSAAEAVRFLRRLLREWRSVAEGGADRAGRGDQGGVRRHIAGRA